MMAEKGKWGLEKDEVLEEVEKGLEAGKALLANMSKTLDLDNMSPEAAKSFLAMAISNDINPELVADLFNASNNEMLHGMARALSLPE